jgi:hypothetical protein
MALQHYYVGRTLVEDREVALQHLMLVRRARRARRELQQQNRLDRRIAALDRRRRHLEALRRRALERAWGDARSAA